MPEKEFDVVITVCGHAHENCPYFAGNATIVHKGFDDPPFLTKGSQCKEEILVIFRRVRDEIKDYVLDVQI